MIARHTSCITNVLNVVLVVSVALIGETWDIGRGLIFTPKLKI